MIEQNLYSKDQHALGELKNHLQCAAIIDTDVNAAALAEYKWGAARNCKVSVYITVGTGVGGGIIVDGKPIHGLIHPEIGHMLLPGHPSIDGTCFFHGGCAEGLSSGTALRKIWGKAAELFTIEDEEMQMQSTILSQLCHNLLVTLSPEKIVLGGGVMNVEGLLEDVISKTVTSMNNYLALPDNMKVSDIIVSPELGDSSGLLGGYALSRIAAKSPV